MPVNPQRTQKRKGKWLLSLFLAAAVGFLSSSVGITMRQLPDELTVVTSGKAELSTFLPTAVEYSSHSDGKAAARLFGLIKLKTMNVNVAAPAKVRLGGTLFGVKMYSDGVMVVGLSDFNSNGRSTNPAREAGISKGDIIKSVNGQPVYTNSEFSEIIEHSNGPVILDILSGSVAEQLETKITLTPQYSDADQSLKTGMWVRDSAAGIGTLTYIDTKSGTFGGLGHGICDNDTQTMIPIHGGDIVEAEFTDVKRGVKGAAGEIRGYLGTKKLGEISSNTICGTFGQYTADIPKGKEYEVAMKQEIKTGKAKILCTVESGEKPKFYDIEIERINYNVSEPAKNMIITVTDEELLAKTGGIVQGMSGSPIIQNGKFVGAVTHVFVNNPTCGYAIFAENMIQSGE